MSDDLLKNYDPPLSGDAESLTQRVRYFNGQFLKDQDFIDDQKYHIDRQRRVNRLLRVSGICEGLALDVNDGKIHVSAGTALDQQGRLLALTPKSTAVTLEGSPDIVDIWLLYGLQPGYPPTQQENELPAESADPELADEATPPGDSSGAAAAIMQGVRGATRLNEMPQIVAIAANSTDDKPATAPPDAVFLGKVNRSTNSVIDDERRQYSGLRLPASEGRGVTLRSLNGAGDHAELSSSLTIQGNLKITQDLLVMGRLKVGESTDDPYQAVVDLELVGHDTGTPPSADKPGRHAYLVARANTHSNYATDLGFRVRKDATWDVHEITDALTIRYDGNVGIGTDSPSTKLNVSGTFKVTGTSSLEGNVGIGTAPGNEQLKVGGNTAIAGTLSVTGNVGIGYQNPGATLALNGGLNVGGSSDPGNGNLEVSGKLTVSGTENSLFQGGLSVRSNLSVEGETSSLNFGTHQRQMVNLGGEEYGIGIQKNTHYFRTEKHFAWYKGGSHSNDELSASESGTVQMVLKNGNLGVGTLAPEHPLHVIQNGNGNAAYLETGSNNSLDTLVVKQQGGGNAAFFSGGHGVEIEADNPILKLTAEDGHKSTIQLREKAQLEGGVNLVYDGDKDTFQIEGIRHNGTIGKYLSIHKDTGNVGIGVDNPQLTLAIGQKQTGWHYENENRISFYMQNRSRLNVYSDGKLKINTIKQSEGKITYEFSDAFSDPYLSGLNDVYLASKGFTSMTLNIPNETIDEVMKTLASNDLKGVGEDVSNQGRMRKWVCERGDLFAGYPGDYGGLDNYDCAILDLPEQFCSNIKVKYRAILAESSRLVFYYKKSSENLYPQQYIHEFARGPINKQEEFSIAEPFEEYDFRWVLFKRNSSDDDEVWIDEIELTYPNNSTTAALSISEKKGVVVGKPKPYPETNLTAHGTVTANSLQVHGTVTANSLQSQTLKSIAVKPNNEEWEHHYSKNSWETIISYTVRPVADVYATIMANGHAQCSEGASLSAQIFLNNTQLHLEKDSGFGLGHTASTSWIPISTLGSTQLKGGEENKIELKIRSWESKLCKLHGPLMVIMLTGS